MPEAGNVNYVHELDHAMPVFGRLKFGATLQDIITQFNLLVVQHLSLVTEHNALLAHLDTAAVTGIGTANVATYAVATTAPPAATAALGTR